MKCEHIEELLSPYLENELDLEQKQMVADHLGACSDCRELLSLHAGSEHVSHRLFLKLKSAVNCRDSSDTIPEKKKRFRFYLDFLIRPSLQPFMAAATVLLTVASFYAFNPNRGEINKAVGREFHCGYQKIGKLYARAESLQTPCRAKRYPDRYHKNEKSLEKRERIKLSIYGGIHGRTRSSNRRKNRRQTPT